MKLLLSSVFGPYGVDDAYGRKENIMELFHNQVTREQGIFSLRFNHPSFGLHFLAENIAAPTMVLDFPSEQRFVQEIKKGYDYIGISFIVPNFIKAKRMAALVRQHAPESRIVLGGHGTRIPGIERMVEHDHICKGEGAKWLRELLGEDPDKPFRHAAVSAAFGRRVIGAPLKTSSAVLVPGVGCPNACRFCATSHFFDKRYTAYFDNGRQLFEQCVALEKRLGVQEFFVMDENFLKRPERAKELLSCMEAHGKTYGFAIFSSAETIDKLGPEFLARLGVYFVWIGVESKYEVFQKNKSIDLRALISQLRDYGISVLASGILFLEQHDKKSIWDDIRFVVDLQADLVQFMGLGPLPGTKLYDDYEQKGLLRKDLPYEEWHGQHQIWFNHPHFTLEESARYLRDAFRFDYDTQGASLLRICETLLRGYEHLASRTDPFMVKRRQNMRKTAEQYRAAIGALIKYAHNARARQMAERLAERFDEVLGPATLRQRLLAKATLAFAAREAARAAAGKNVYQPKTLTTSYRLPLGDRIGSRFRAWNDVRKLAAEWPSQPVVADMPPQ